MGFCRFRYPVLSSYAGATTELDYMEYADTAAAQAAYVTTDSSKIQSYTEASIKKQGTRSLKILATILGDGAQYVERTIGSPIDLSDKNVIKLYIYCYSGYENDDFTLSIYDTTTGATPIVTKVLSIEEREGATWKQILIDISDIANADKDTVDKIRITFTVAGGSGHIYIDDLKAVSEETLTLSSIPVNLPLPITPIPNQIISDAISGVRQTAELGDTRQSFNLVYPHMSNSEYEDLNNFLESLTQYKLNPFEYSQRGIPQSWNVYLDDYSHEYLANDFHSVSMKLIEKVV